ncbi:ABC transporter permease subunit [Paenibacillus sp. 5J-6]|uniref:ABC transporter permease subunit n=1 Tax=Paenibacillus silvestris TaxID=2606219 RepID=A0A6L8V9A9_9BACL|nr:ABC transporter permease subunit [Paenibacillus silvestris]MZQ86252.1 ABC transporter permease subunit [Paenibacillus silvestris]
MTKPLLSTAEKPTFPISLRDRLSKPQLVLQLMVLPAVLAMLIFNFLPMLGMFISFKETDLTNGIFGGQWVGFEHFQEIFEDDRFWLAMKNTVGMSIVKLVFTFIAPILFALVMNEIRSSSYKKLVQTISTLPHFLSYVIVATLCLIFLDPQGMVNHVLMSLHVTKEPIGFMADAKWFWGLGSMLDLWKETGWGAIVFLAAITGVNSEIYEAAKIDGAGRLRCIWHINLPAIRSTIMVMLILNIGNLFYGGSNFDQSYLLGNMFNYDRSYTLGYYTLDNGLIQMRYSFAAAADLIISTLSLTLLLVTNWTAKKINGSNIF